MHQNCSLALFPLYLFPKILVLVNSYTVPEFTQQHFLSLFSKQHTKRKERKNCVDSWNMNVFLWSPCLWSSFLELYLILFMYSCEKIQALLTEVLKPQINTEISQVKPMDWLVSCQIWYPSTLTSSLFFLF